MDSDSSSFAPPSTQDSSCMKTRGISAHTTWAQSRWGIAANGEDPKKHYCIHCTTTDKIYSTKTTTNFCTHLEKEHRIIIEREPTSIQAIVLQQLKSLYLQAKSAGESKEIDTQVFQGYLDQDAINEALVSLIVVRSLPFRAVEWPELHTLCQLLNPEAKDFLTTAHSQVSRKINQSWIYHKDSIRRKLQSAISRIHLSLDIWTSPNRHLLLGICAHFV
jgi:hypothetical protein